MANYLGIYSVGASLVEHLNAVYPETLRDEFPCEFRMVSGHEMAEPNRIISDQTNVVTFFLYRTTQNEHLRHIRHTSVPNGSIAPLIVDLHYLVSVWAMNGRSEHVVFAWVLRKMFESATLNVSTLMPAAQWRGSDVLQVIPAEMSDEDLMRIWDALEPPYRLTKSYIIRAVQIDGDEPDRAYEPVVTSRLDVGDMEEAL